VPKDIPPCLIVRNTPAEKQNSSQLKNSKKKVLLIKIGHFLTSAKTHTGLAIVALQKGACFRNGNSPILENFGNAEVYIFRTPAGYVIPNTHVAKATGIGKPSITKMLQRNSESSKRRVFLKNDIGKSPYGVGDFASFKTGWFP